MANSDSQSSNSPAPGSKAEKLMRAHIAHELALFEPQQESELKAVLEQELGAFHDWVSTRKVEELAPSAEVIAFLKRALIETKPTQASIEFGVETAAALLGALGSRTEIGADLLSRDAFDKAVEELGGNEKLRRTGVHLMVNNAVFAMVVSETLYHGIEDFMTQSKLTQNIPGAQSLFKLGQDMLSSAVPGLKDNFEKTIKEFIKNNAGNIIKNSEEFLNRSLGPETIKEAANQLWDDVAERPVAELSEYVAGESLGVHGDILRAFVDKFRSTDFFADLLKVVVDTFYAKYGDAPIGDVLKMNGLEKDLLLSEAIPPLLNLAKVARESGYLEEVLERRLGAFYASSAAGKLL